MPKSKGKAAREHSMTQVFGYTKSRSSGHRHSVGGGHGGKMTARGERVSTRRRKTSWWAMLKRPRKYNFRGNDVTRIIRTGKRRRNTRSSARHRWVVANKYKYHKYKPGSAKPKPAPAKSPASSPKPSRREQVTSTLLHIRSEVQSLPGPIVRRHSHDTLPRMNLAPSFGAPYGNQLMGIGSDWFGADNPAITRTPKRRRASHNAADYLDWWMRWSSGIVWIPNSSKPVPR
jgi:hypothetical protein